MAFTEVIPYLYYADADAALDWLERVLGFGPSTRWRLGGPSTREADIRVGDARVSISGRAPAGAGGEGAVGEGAGALIIVHVDDVQAFYERVRSVEPGAAPDAPVTQPYGPTMFTVVDPWGYRWNFWQGEADPPQPNAS
ncbi:VOC family protein [Herbiconiux daphne]|uniref:VOC family protein n=1 Tax=Herbiconiux daphne TaxID=2970914 RepID=A0ABT2H1L2_9MICO|nr:VOC family protein [Herbiconiux daphne]MCS5733810.1 VOC family protein [Herbiconiux daphne]